MVRDVTLFKITRSNVRAFGDVIPMMYHDRPVRCFNSKDIFLENDIATQYNARIHRIRNSNKLDQFIAFDHELNEIVELFKYEAAQKSTQNAIDVYVPKIEELKAQIKCLQSRTIWSMIVSKFKRSKA